MILEKTLPEEMFRLVVNLMGRDVSGPVQPTKATKGGKKPKRKSRTGQSSRGPPSEASSQEWDKVTERDGPAATGQAA